MQNTLLKLDQCFWRCSRHFDVLSSKIKHIWGRIHSSQRTVGVKETALKLRFQTVGGNNLKNITLADIVLGLFDDLTVFFQRETWRYLTFESSAKIFS